MAIDKVTALVACLSSAAASDRFLPAMSRTAVDFMAKRRLASHGSFLLYHLKTDSIVLDSGCGPGSITVDVAEVVSDGMVVGVDFGMSQVRTARAVALTNDPRNVRLIQANTYDLPFPASSFDIVYAHALLEHLRTPEQALHEFRRVLKPEGILAVCSPDWTGFLVVPRSPALAQAIQCYMDLQTANGGQIDIGGRLGELLLSVGFDAVEMSAKYECYESLESIGRYLADQIEKTSESRHAQTLRRWSQSQDGMFAQSWVSAVGRKPA